MKQQTYSAMPFFLAACAEILTRLFVAETVDFSAKEGILGAALAALAVWLCLTALHALNLSVTHKPFLILWLCLLLPLLLLAGAGVVFRLAQVYRGQFAGSTIWLLLLTAGLLALRPSSGALERASHAAFALVVLAAAILVLGLCGQLRWYVLSVSPPTVAGTAAAVRRTLCFLPEFFALPLFAGKSDGRRIPIWLFWPEAAVLLGSELLFGYQTETGRYPAAEMLRAWGLGAFSRMDAVVIGLWLILMLFRLLLIEDLFIRSWRLLRYVGRREGGRNAA